MDTRYWVPKISDLREGFKFELQVYDEEKDEYIDEWQEHTFDVRSGLGHDEYHTFTDGRVRALIPTPSETYSAWFGDITKDKFRSQGVSYLPYEKGDFKKY